MKEFSLGQYDIGDDTLYDKRGKPVPWGDVMFAVPDISLNHLAQ